MQADQIPVHKVTKPIQLLAAWLVGLILIDTSFLTAAATIVKPTWAPALLVVAAVLNVPLFLICLFTLQTKFRPQMQEDTYYASYLEKSTGSMLRQIQPAENPDSLKPEFSELTKQTLQMIKSLDERLGNLTQDVSKLSIETSASPELKKRLDVLEQQSIEFSKLIQGEQQKLDWRTVQFQINDRLPNYSRVVEILHAQGVTGHTIFGSNTLNEVPKQLVIGFAPQVTIDVLRHVVRLLEPEGFDVLDFAQEARAPNAIYIGSYKYRIPETKAMKPIDANLKALLFDSRTDMRTLTNYLMRPAA